MVTQPLLGGPHVLAIKALLKEFRLLPWQRLVNFLSDIFNKKRKILLTQIILKLKSLILTFSFGFKNSILSTLNSGFMIIFKF